MKKILIALSILSIIGCTKNNYKTETNKIEEDSQIKIEESKYIDNNPIKIGIYKNNKLLTNYKTNFTDNTDIGVFDIYYTNIETLDNKSAKENYKNYYNNYENIEEYKTGFYISFETGNEKHEVTVLDASQTFALDPYIYIYLYDDINQPDNTHYSHIEPEQLNENTIFSSIKLYMPLKSNEITSSITLTVFTYKNEFDFDEYKHYRGNSSYTISIDRLN